MRILLKLLRWLGALLRSFDTCERHLFFCDTQELIAHQVFGTPRNISIPESSFKDGQGTFSTQLPFAEGHKFIITMSDGTGFGSGGSTEVLNVEKSKGGSCNTTDPGVDFTFELNSALTQCRRFTFSAYSGARAPVTILGIIPGGTPFVLNPPANSNSFDWVTNVFNGTSIVFALVDSQGRQGGSSDLKVVGASDDISCINSNSPSSTMSTPSSPTSSGTDAGSSPSNGSSTSIGAIAGTVIGGLVFLAVAITLGLFFLRRNRSRSQDIRDWDDGHGYGGPPRRLRPEFDPSDPALLAEQPTPAPYSANPFSSGSEVDVRSQQHGSVSHSYDTSHPATEIHPFTAQQSAAAPSTAAQRKSAMAGVSSYKPSRFVLHTDAEDAPPQEEEEVVELPPMYSERKPR
ncbi:hypothetical protein PQX77_007218 [Marasmius sp. AFHP31]|nr:hypothetical protein PQX77_007218 [Marasmius sp. AFHP31]